MAQFKQSQSTICLSPFAVIRIFFLKYDLMVVHDLMGGGGGLTSALYGGRKAKEEDLKKYLQEESNKTYKLENKEGWQ